MLDDQFRLDLSTYDPKDVDRLAETLRTLERRFNDLPQCRIYNLTMTGFSATSTNTSFSAATAYPLTFTTAVPNQSVLFLISASAVRTAGAGYGVFRPYVDRTLSTVWYPTAPLGVLEAPYGWNSQATFQWFKSIPVPGTHTVVFNYASSDGVTTMAWSEDTLLSVISPAC